MQAMPDPRKGTQDAPSYDRRGLGGESNQPSSTRVERAAFVATAMRHGVDDVVAEAMWAELAGVSDPRAELAPPIAPGADQTRLSRAVTALLALGGVLVIASSIWWATELEANDVGLVVLCVAYGAVFLLGALYGLSRGYDQLAAVAATITAFYVPAATAAALHVVGFGFDYDDNDVMELHQWWDAGWLWVELVALAGVVVLYRVFRAPLLMLPLSTFAALFLMDALARALGVGVGDRFDARTVGVLILAVALLAGVVAVVLDYRGLRRHALWPHVIAAITLLYGVLLLVGESSWEVALIISGAVYFGAGIQLGRLGFVVAGAVALWIGVTALAPSPVVVTVSGLAAVAVGIWLSLAQSPLRRWLSSRSVPAPQRD